MTKQEEITSENILSAIYKYEYKTIKEYFNINKSDYSSYDFGYFLMHSILENKLQLSKLFVKLGADLEAEYQFDGYSEDPMFYAIVYVNIKAVNYLYSIGIKPKRLYDVEYFAKNLKNKEGVSELILFLMKNNYATDVNGYSDDDGVSRLLTLSDNKKFKDAFIFAIRNGADVNKLWRYDEDLEIKETILDKIKKFNYSSNSYTVYLEILAQAEKEILENDLNTNLPKRTGGILKD